MNPFKPVIDRRSERFVFDNWRTYRPVVLCGPRGGWRRRRRSLEWYRTVFWFLAVMGALFLGAILLMLLREQLNGI